LRDSGGWSEKKEQKSSDIIAEKEIKVQEKDGKGEWPERTKIHGEKVNVSEKGKDHKREVGSCQGPRKTRPKDQKEGNRNQARVYKKHQRQEGESMEKVKFDTVVREKKKKENGTSHTGGAGTPNRELGRIRSVVMKEESRSFKKKPIAQQGGGGGRAGKKNNEERVTGKDRPIPGETLELK